MRGNLDRELGSIAAQGRHFEDPIQYGSFSGFQKMSEAGPMRPSKSLGYDLPGQLLSGYF